MPEPFDWAHGPEYVNWASRQWSIQFVLCLLTPLSCHGRDGVLAGIGTWQNIPSDCIFYPLLSRWTFLLKQSSWLDIPKCRGLTTPYLVGPIIGMVFASKLVTDYEDGMLWLSGLTTPSFLINKYCQDQNISPQRGNGKLTLSILEPTSKAIRIILSKSFQFWLLSSSFFSSFGSSPTRLRILHCLRII